MSNNLYNDFKINTAYQASIVPSTTFYSRNAIFSGYFPLDLYNNNRELYNRMSSNESEYNKHEHELLKQQLTRLGLGHKSTKYVKVSSYEYGKSIVNNINDYKNVDMLCLVVNFIDILAHSRSESNVLKELCSKPNIVLATGGGAVISENNRLLIKKTGSVIYLLSSVDQILRRTAKSKTRPLLENSSDRRKTIADIIDSRDPLYREVATIIINTNGKKLNEIIKEIQTHSN